MHDDGEPGSLITKPTIEHPLRGPFISCVSVNSRPVIERLYTTKCKERVSRPGDPAKGQTMSLDLSYNTHDYSKKIVTTLRYCTYHRRLWAPDSRPRPTLTNPLQLQDNKASRTFFVRRTTKAGSPNIAYCTVDLIPQSKRTQFSGCHVRSWRWCNEREYIHVPFNDS